MLILVYDKIFICCIKIYWYIIVVIWIVCVFWRKIYNLNIYIEFNKMLIRKKVKLNMDER